MTNPNVSLSQITVIITIVGVDDNAQAHYTYADPSMNGIHLEELKSKVWAVAPFSVLYALDYASSRNGWRIERLEDWSGYPTTPCALFNDDMAIFTVYAIGPDHNFYLHFKNMRVKGPDHKPSSFKDDPQEGNIRRPT